MYTIYFGYKPSGRRKIGCDSNYPQRPESQSMTNYRILEQYEDIYIASQREQELQREYGLKVDSIPYWKSIENGYKITEKKTIASRNNLIQNNVASLGGLAKSTRKLEAARENIKIATAAAVLAGAPGKAGKVAANKERKCPYCGKEGKGPTMYRYHYENCKYK